MSPKQSTEEQTLTTAREAAPQVERRVMLVFWAIVLAGVIMRVLRYAANQSLFVDEAALVVNILERDFGALLLPLRLHQSAPVAFMWMVKATTVVFGTSELAVRIVPLLAGCAAVVAMMRLSTRALGIPGAFVATTLMACSWQLVNYSHFAKQYAADMLAATVCLQAGYWFSRNRRSAITVRTCIVASVGGAVLLWFSHPAVFMLGGVIVVITIVCYRQKGIRGIVYAVVPAVVWAATFVAQYALVMRYNTQNRLLVAGWNDYFAPLPVRSFADVQWYGMAFLNLFKEIDGTPVSAITGVLSTGVALVGVVFLYRTRRDLLCLTVIPILLALAASALRVYPFSHRLLFFCFPCVIILIACGIDSIARTGRYGSAIAAGVGLALVTPAAGKSLAGTLLQPGTQEMRPVVERLTQMAGPGDVVALHYSAQPAFEYYCKHRLRSPLYAKVVASELGLPHGTLPDADTDRVVYPNQLRPLLRYGSVWMVFSESSLDVLKSQEYIRSLLDRAGKRVSEIRADRASAFLYRFGNTGHPR